MSILGRLPGASLADRRAAYVAARQRLNRAAVDEGPAALAHYLANSDIPPDGEPVYVRRAHTDLMANAVLAMDNGGDRHVLITCPPQVGKTVTAVVWTAFWWLIRHPRHRILIVSYNAGLAVDRGTDIKKLVATYGARYGLTLVRGSSSKTDWRLTTGGGVLSVGLGGGITGRPADLILLDDLVKSRKEADSLTYRQATWDALSADVWTRRSPGAAMIYTTTLWHPDDAAGRFLKRDGATTEGGLWRVIRLPALADSPDDPLGRTIGAPLPHPKIDPADIQAHLDHWHFVRRGQIPRDWWAMCQCDPRPAEGALLTQEMIDARRVLQPTARPRRHGVGVDPSGDGRDTCGIVAGYLADDGGIYITHDRTDVLSSLEWPERVCLLAAQIGADVIVIESNFGGGMGASMILTTWATLHRDGHVGPRCPRIVSATARKSKVLRAEDVIVDVQRKRVWFTDVFSTLEYELCTWRPGDVDSPGAVDAFVHLAHELLPQQPRQTGVSPVTSVARVSRSQYTGRTTGTRRRR